MENARALMAGGVVFCESAYEGGRGADGVTLLTEWNEFKYRTWTAPGPAARLLIFDALNLDSPSACGGSASRLLHRGASPSGRLRSRARSSAGDGRAGFIGSHLCDFLLARGCEVVCRDNLLTGATDNIATARPAVPLVKHDGQLHRGGRPLDYVLHFASPASPIDYWSCRSDPQGRALGTPQGARAGQGRRASFPLAATSEVYGDPLVQPAARGLLGQRQPVARAGLL